MWFTAATQWLTVLGPIPGFPSVAAIENTSNTTEDQDTSNKLWKTLQWSFQLKCCWFLENVAATHEMLLPSRQIVAGVPANVNCWQLWATVLDPLYSHTMNGANSNSAMQCTILRTDPVTGLAAWHPGNHKDRFMTPNNRRSTPCTVPGDQHP